MSDWGVFFQSMALSGKTIFRHSYGSEISADPLLYPDITELRYSMPFLR